MVGEDQSQEWDDLHFGADDSDGTAPVNAVDDIDGQVFSSEESLEGSKLLSKEDDDEQDQDKSIIKPTEKTKKPGEVDEEPPVSEDMSGIELYLSQFDIEAGMIQFEDGTSSHFNDLDPAKQAEILQQLHNAQATSVEDKYGLDENEVGLINYLRENNLSVDEMVEAKLQEKLASTLSLKDIASTDYEKMEPDALYLKFLKESSPEATPEQIAENLTKAKELSNYDKITNSLRSQYIKQQKDAIASAEDKNTKDHQDLIEQQRQEIVDTVIPMKEIAGIELDQNVKNTVLDHILETNEDGDSAFMDEVFSDPANLFKAAFWFVYGDALVSQRDEYWKKEKSAAYKRGREDALGITSKEQSGKSFSSKSVTGSKIEPHTARSTQETEELEDWTSLYDKD